MKREDFKIVQKYYATNELTYIFYNNIIIGSVEIYKDLFFIEVEKDSWKSQKKKRKPDEISSDCERVISNYIKSNT